MSKPCAARVCPFMPTSPHLLPPHRQRSSQQPIRPSSPSPRAPQALPRGWWSATRTWSPRHSAMSATGSTTTAPSPTSRTPPWLATLQRATQKANTKTQFRQFCRCSTFLGLVSQWLDASGRAPDKWLFQSEQRLRTFKCHQPGLTRCSTPLSLQLRSRPFSTW